jgi:hypothetical protein
MPCLGESEEKFAPVDHGKAVVLSEASRQLFDGILYIVAVDGIIYSMKAMSLISRRVALSRGALAEIVLWKVPEPLKGSRHRYKYRLALVADGI